MSNVKLIGILAGINAALLATACATTPPPDDSSLVQAREAVAKLEADPLAQQKAGKPLQEARDALHQAETDAQQGNHAEAVHFAYIARRKADAGEAMTDEDRALQRIAQAKAQRDAVLMADREREAQAARNQAAAAQAQAAMASQQAADADARAAAAKKRLKDMQSQSQ